VDDIYPIDGLLQAGTVVVPAESSRDGVPNNHGEHKHHRHSDVLGVRLVPRVEEVVQERELHLDHPEGTAVVSLFPEEPRHDEPPRLGTTGLPVLVIGEPPPEQLEQSEGQSDVLEDAAVLPAEDAHALAVDPLPDGVDRGEGARGDGRPVVRLGEVGEREVLPVEYVPVSFHGGAVEDMAGLVLGHHVVGDHLGVLHEAVRPARLPQRLELGVGLGDAQDPEDPDGGAVAPVPALAADHQPQQQHDLQALLQQRPLPLLDVAQVVGGEGVGARLHQEAGAPQDEGLVVERAGLQQTDGVGDEDGGERVDRPDEEAEGLVAAPVTVGAQQDEEGQEEVAEEVEDLHAHQLPFHRPQALDDGRRGVPQPHRQLPFFRALPCPSSSPRRSA